MKLQEIEQGLGLLAAEVEVLLETRPVNLLYWQRQIRDVIAELEEGRWAPTSGRRRSTIPPDRRDLPG